MKIYLISFNKKMSQIKDYENYLIFEDGVVINSKTGREAKPTIANNGYYVIGLSNDKKRKLFLLHRILGITFIPNPDNKPFVDHINRDKLDNRIENLRWATYKENTHNQKSFTNTGYKFISKINKKNYKQGFYYQFRISRPISPIMFCNKDLQAVIEYRNKFCAENNIEFNDSL
tara:strand:+ start:202 stop:723 length:522 start_codon:yes stop_codon:yes gene_type:complete